MSVWTSIWGSEKSQVPPASQAKPASQEAISSAEPAGGFDLPCAGPWMAAARWEMIHVDRASQIRLTFKP